MSNNITKALYLGVALLLFASAFSAYLHSYGELSGYCSAAAGTVEAYDMPEKNETSGRAVMSGNEVICLILEKRSDDAEAILRELYGSASGGTDSLPDIRIDGMAYADFDIMSVDTNKKFNATFTFDRQGNPICVNLETVP